MTDPTPDVEEFDPGPVPELMDDAEAGALAALTLAEIEQANYATTHKLNPTAEEVD